MFRVRVGPYAVNATSQGKRDFLPGRKPEPLPTLEGDSFLPVERELLALEEVAGLQA